MKTIIKLFVLFFASTLIISCDRNMQSWNFNDSHDRVWIGEDFWNVPLEDWRVNNGRIKCTGNNPNMRVNILTYLLNGEGKFNISVKVGIEGENKAAGSAGFRLGITDDTDSDIRSLCYYGEGVDAGIDLSGELFIDDVSIELPADFNFETFILSARAERSAGVFSIVLTASDTKQNSYSVSKSGFPGLKGMIALVNNFEGKGKSTGNFWFDDLRLSGSMVEAHPENSFGPILFNMYTLSRNTLKMSVQMPPLGEDDEQSLEFQQMKENEFTTTATTTIRKDSRIGLFNISEWDDKTDHPYRVLYHEKDKKGNITTHSLEGIITKNPEKDKLLMAGMTCQHWQAYPYTPVYENIRKSEPDILYFSGDQIYEANGGYGIIREDPEMAILNYLGKWYMFGWAFGDLMKNRPTICIPDDHEIYQGNLWGAGGKRVSIEEWNKDDDCISGFVQPPEMIHVVMETNTAHLPDPYDPEPMKNNIPVYYTDLIFGKVSFAIIGDRVFKSGPENISWWEGRKDHIKFEVDNPDILDKKGLKLLGDRQLEFLEDWACNWKNAEMKCVLSQTLFTNAATHHGGDKMYLVGDMDSGGWPKSGRDRALSAIRKAWAFHICGDQHIPSLIQYGIDDQRDAGWAFCTPAISVGYERRFQPDRLGRPVVNRPPHNNSNTGEYRDVFGNYFYVYAIGNPEDNTNDPDRFQVAQKRASGFGLIEFNTEERTITADAFRFLAEVEDSSPDGRFPGWPLTVNQKDNYNRSAAGFLPVIQIEGKKDPVLEIRNQQTNELVYCIRIKGNEFLPAIFKKGYYKLTAGYPESNEWKTMENISSSPDPASDTLRIIF